MPPTQVKPDNGYEALERVIDGGHREEGFGVCHEARRSVSLLYGRIVNEQQTWLFFPAWTAARE